MIIPCALPPQADTRLFPKTLQDAIALINVQHNCHDARCSISGPPLNLLNIAIGRQNQMSVTHNPTPSFIVNSGSLYNAELHRQVANTPVPVHSPQDNLHAIAQGLDRWRHSTGPVDAPPPMTPNIP